MSETSERLGEFLRAEFERKNELEGRTFADPLTWREIAIRNKIPENSLIRWKEGVNPPTNPEHITALVNEFGADVLVIMGFIDPELAFFVDHIKNPKVRKVFRDARDRAKNLVAGGDGDKAYNPVN